MCRWFDIFVPRNQLMEGLVMSGKKVDSEKHPKDMSYEEFKKAFPEGLTEEVGEKYFPDGIPEDVFDRLDPVWEPAEDAVEDALRQLDEQLKEKYGY